MNMFRRHRPAALRAWLAALMLCMSPFDAGAAGAEASAPRHGAASAPPAAQVHAAPPATPARPAAATSPGAAPDGPQSRRADYYVTFKNKGPASITLQKLFDLCMYGAGPSTVYIAPFDQQQVHLADDNNFFHGCTDTPKLVFWAATTHSSDGTFHYNFNFFHEIIGKAGITMIMGAVGSSSGDGLLTSAQCDGIPCLDTPAPGTGDFNIDVNFDGSYSGPGPRPVLVTSPARRTAQREGGSWAVSGVGTPDTQVTVTVRPDSGGSWTDSPTVDKTGNWTTSAKFPHVDNDIVHINAKDTRGTSDDMEFLLVDPVTIGTPSSSQVPWTPTTPVKGVAAPNAHVLVQTFKPNGDQGPSCTTTADGMSGAFACQLQGLAAGASYQLTVTQTGKVTDSNGTWTWADPPVTLPIQVGLAPLTITDPADGTHVDGDEPVYRSVKGTSTPRAQITINSPYAMQRGRVTASADDKGNWQTDPVFHFPPGSSTYEVDAQQTYDGTQGPDAQTHFQSWETLQIANPRKRTTLASSQGSLTAAGTGQKQIRLDPALSGGAGSVCQPHDIGSDGKWTCQIDGLRPDTNYVFSAYQASGSQSDPAATVAFRVARPVSIASPGNGQSYPLGTSNLTMRGSGEPGAFVSASVPNATTCGVQQVGAGGDWSCPISGLQSGDYTASVTQSSDPGMRSGMDWTDPPATVRFTVQGFSPLTISSPGDHQMFPSDTTDITMTGNGQINAQLNVNVPGARACPQTTINPPGNWSCGISGLRAGTGYLATVKQSYGAMVDKPAFRNFSVASPVHVDLPVEGAVLAAQTTQYTATGTGQPLAQLSISLGSAPTCNTTVGATGRWECTLTGLYVGTAYTAQVTQRGDGWSDPPVTRSFRVAQAAKIAITYPVGQPATVSSDNPFDGLTVMGKGQPTATAQVTIGDIAVPEATIAQDGTWVTVPTDLSRYSKDGSPRLTIVAKEYLDGNVQSTDQTDIVVAKAATVTFPTENEIVDYAKVIVTGTGHEGATIEMTAYVDTGTELPCHTQVQGGRWTCTITGLQPGQEVSLSVEQSGQGWRDLPVTVDFSTRKVLPITITAPDGYHAILPHAPYSVFGTGEPNGVVTLRMQGFADIGQVTTDPYGNWLFSNVLRSNDGCYWITATQSVEGYAVPGAISRQYAVGAGDCTATMPVPAPAQR